MGRPECGNREGENVLCPLFVAFTETEIRCHAHVPDASATILKYTDRGKCRQQRTIFCEGCWNRCEHYQAWRHLMWDDDE